MTVEEKFFRKLSLKVEEAYVQSDLYLKFGDKNWGYAISATRLTKRVPIICGFNWGAGQEWREDQSVTVGHDDYPTQHFSEIELLGSYKRIVKHFQEYIPQAMQGVLCNYCFFRSEFEHQLGLNDLKLCEPLFTELVEFLDPQCIITFSKSLKNHLQLQGKLRKMDEVGFKSGKRSVRVSRGIVLCGEKEVDFYKLPHPNFPTVADARKKAWKFCFSG